MASNNIRKYVKRPIVLIADDLYEVLCMWSDELRDYGLGFLPADSLDELHHMFEHYHQGIAAIIIDGCIPGHTPNTLEFIKLARLTGFDKPIIAASSSPLYRNMMVDAGCSHQAPKAMAAELVADLLTRP